jgi:hypothetical protein
MFSCDQVPMISVFYFVWNEPFKSLWEIGYIQNMAEVTGLRTKAQRPTNREVE